MVTELSRIAPRMQRSTCRRRPAGRALAAGDERWLTRFGPKLKGVVTGDDRAR
jgi:hypothetical protein